MQPMNRTSLLRWRQVFAFATALATAFSAQAQVAPAGSNAATAQSLARYDLNKNGVLDPEERAAMEANVASTGSSSSTGDVVVMSPFEVNADNNGYYGANSLSGTRLNSRIEDLAASITVVTKQQLLDTAAVDINDIFRNEGNVEGIYQYTDFVIDRGNVVDNVSQSPETANRVRGLGTANLARGSFAASNSIPIDTYNIDAVEISRGPNSNIFGLGDAAGTINLITSRANLKRDITSFSIRTDTNDSFRSTFDINRPIIKDVLAVRVQGVYEDKEFEQKPSRDKTNRLQASVTWQPYRNTTVRASYESYHNYNSRPNSTTPRDFITEWQANGSPVWDPTFSSGTGGWRLLNGSTYTAVTQANEAAQFPRGLAPNFTNFYVRPSWFIDNGAVQLYTVNRSALAPTGTNIPSPGQANAQTRYAQIGTLISRGGGAFGSVSLPLYTQPGITSKSLYDWENVNIAATNWAKKRADIYQVELEQFILNTPRNLLALQAGYYREDIEDHRRSFIGAVDGARAEIQIDVNEKLLDGSANPFYLRPYIGGSEPQAFRRPIENENSRAVLAYQLDMTQESGWQKWIGRHRLAAYGEFKETIRSPQGLRYRDKVVSNNPWVNTANKTAGAHTSIWPRYYLGDATGFNIDYSPVGLEKYNGDFNMRWFNATPAVNRWVEEPVTVEEIYFALGKERSQIRTMGGVWQGFLWNERIIPTWGYRKDRQRRVNNVPAVVDPSTGLIPTANLDVFPATWSNVGGVTETRGIVVKPLNWLSFHYNEADNFQPAPEEYNIYRQLLPNPTGDGKDYGFRLNLLQGKLTIGYNEYETFEKDKRSTIGVVMTRIRRLETDGGNDTGGDNDLDDFLTNELLTLYPTWTAVQIENEAEKLMGLKPGQLETLRNLGLNDVNNATSKGKEIEINYNPNRYWTLKANLTQQLAIDSDLSPNAQKYISERLPVWTTVRGPASGTLWWGTSPGNASQNPQLFYEGIVLAPLKLAITTQNKPKPQTREWRFNMTTNYKLAGMTDHKWLKNLDVGGSLRWNGKVAIGFLGEAPDPDGVVRSLDGNKPVFDKARYSADFSAGYNLRLMNDRVRCRLQLNVRDVFESGRLEAVGVNPDGTFWNYRIINPRQFILTATFDL